MKTKILSGILLVLLIISFFIFYIGSKKGETITKKDYEPDWKNLRTELMRAVRDTSCERISKIDSTLENFEVKKLEEPGSYLILVNDILSAKDSICYTDEYPLLIKVTEVFEHQNPNIKLADSIAGNIVNRYLDMGLFRRAYELMQLADLDKSQKTKNLFDRIQWILDESEKYANYHKGHNLDENHIESRLCNLLSALPMQNWYNEIYTGKDTLAPGIESGVDSMFQSKAFFHTLYDSQKELNHEYYSPDNDTLELDFVSIDDSLVTSYINELYHTTQLESSLSIVTSSRAFSVLRDSAITNSFSYSEGQNLNLLQVFRQDKTLILIFYTERNELITEVIEKRGLNRFYMLIQSDEGYESAMLKDVTGDGKNEFIKTSRAGSASYLSASIFSLNPFAIIWNKTDYSRGNMAIVDTDFDNDLEIIFSYRSELGIAACNQCPRRYISEIYDYNHLLNQMVKIDNIGSSTEMMLRTNDNLAGMSPNMIRGTMISVTGHPDINTYLTSGELFETLRDPEEYRNLIEAYLAESDFLKNMQNTSELIDLNKKMVPFLNSLRRIRKVEPEFLLVCKIGVLEGLYIADRHQEFDSYILTLEKSELETIDVKNLKGIDYLVRGKYHLAYQNLSNADTTTNGENEMVQGNLALYFNIVGDYKSSHEYAKRALNLALLSDDGGYTQQVIDMLHISNALPVERTNEKIDYLIRAVRISRAFPSGGQTPEILLAGANIAINTGNHEIALKLLDQGIAFAIESEWYIYRSEFTYLYAKVHLLLNKPDAASYYFKLNLKFSRTSPDAFSCYAAYNLSKIYFKSGNLPKALEYSQNSFELLKNIRKLIGLKNHKYSFLNGKNEVAGWYFKLLVELKSPNDNIFNQLESWKLQSFFDQVEIEPQLLKSNGQSDVLNITQKNLKEDDLFLDYFISNQVSFVITIQKDKPIVLNRLDITETDASASINATRDLMDLSKPNSSSFITSDKIPFILNEKMTFLGDKLLGFITKIRKQPIRLIISPDQTLYGLPWNALLIKEKFLIDKFEVALLPSAKTGLLLFKNIKSSRKKALLVAALAGVSSEKMTKEIPVFEASTSQFNLAQLKHGITEIMKVGAALENSSYKVSYLADSATRRSARLKEYDILAANPENFLNLAKENNIIHLLAHGLFNKYDPMSSIIFLEKGKKRFVLRPADFQNLNLKSTDIISLAACQTGINEMMTGAEPVGFLQSLLLSGASTSVLMEWKIDDWVTSQIFENFYSKVSITNKSKSLRQSLLQVKAKYRHPYFWSGVSMYGDPN